MSQYVTGTSTDNIKSFQSLNITSLHGNILLRTMMKPARIKPFKTYFGEKKVTTIGIFF